MDATQEKLEDIFDDSDLDVDLESSAGVLTVKFESGRQLIFSRQEPLRQLWLAARSGGVHFDYDEESGNGSATRAKSCSEKWSQRLTLEQAGVELELEESLKW